MSDFATHYDNLRVTRNASPAVIRAAYKALAQEYHPDRCKRPDAERIMQRINDAYAVLSDEEKRAEHDKWIAQAEKKAKKQVPAISKQIDNLRALYRGDLYELRRRHAEEVNKLRRSNRYERIMGIIMGLVISVPLHIIVSFAGEAIQGVQHAYQQKEVAMLRN